MGLAVSVAFNYFTSSQSPQSLMVSVQTILTLSMRHGKTETEYTSCWMRLKNNICFMSFCQWTCWQCAIPQSQKRGGDCCSTALGQGMLREGWKSGKVGGFDWWVCAMGWSSTLANVSPCTCPSCYEEQSHVYQSQCQNMFLAGYPPFCYIKLILFKCVGKCIKVSVFLVKSFLIAPPSCPEMYIGWLVLTLTNTVQWLGY